VRLGQLTDSRTVRSADGIHSTASDRGYRRRATTMPRRKAIANECKGASCTSPAMVSSGMPGLRPISIASLTRWLAARNVAAA
jgi:hypothetical protein